MAIRAVPKTDSASKVKVPECFTAFNVWSVYGEEFTSPYDDLIRLLPAYEFMAKAIDREIADCENLAIGAGRILQELNKRLHIIANETEALQYPEEAPNA